MSRLITRTSPMGWNSFDCYGRYTYEQDVKRNIDYMAGNLKQYGYEYVITDIGWYGMFHYDYEGQKYPSERHASDVCMDEYGRYVSSEKMYPGTVKEMCRYAHEKGLKFGVHLMRGVPRKAVEMKLPIKGTEYTCDMIANIEDTCAWCHYNYGIDMSKPGAYEYYKSVIELMEEWEIDFIKYDDITGFPEEVCAVAKAIEEIARPMILSLSPGGDTKEEFMKDYQKANMLRITEDIWDNQESIDQVFERLKTFYKYHNHDFYIDLDMLSIGHLMLCRPREQFSAGDRNALISGQGLERMCALSIDQQKTFMTIRALCASPLMIGSDLPTMGETAYQLITNRDIIECNQRTRKYVPVDAEEGIVIWKSDAGYVGIFNTDKKRKRYPISVEKIGLAENTLIKDVWMSEEMVLKEKTEIELEANGVFFFKILD